MKNLHAIQKSIILLLFFFFAATNLFATHTSVSITYSMSVADIENNIQNAIDVAAPGDVIIVAGSKTDETGVIELNILTDVTVIWNAFTKDLSINFDGGGTFEVTANGRLEVKDKNTQAVEAIKVQNGNVIVSGGEVSAAGNGGVGSVARSILVENGNVTVTGGEVSSAGSTWLNLDGNNIFGAAIDVKNGNVTVTNGNVSTLSDGTYAMAIHVESGSVTVSGGKVSSLGNSAAIHIDGYDGVVSVSGGEVSATAGGGLANNCYGIRLNADGTVVVTGGLVLANGALSANYAILIGWGLVAYYTGTCISDDGFNVWYQDYGIVVEVNSFTIPPAYHETNNGLAYIEGGALSDSWWDTSGSIPLINFYYNGYSYSVPWMEPEPPVVIPGTPVVRLRETGDLFATISEAITEAKSAGHTTFTLEVLGDIVEIDDVIIDTEDVTIVGAEGTYTVTMSPPSLKFSLEGGGTLTLGEGMPTDILTIAHLVSVTDGTIHVKDGIIIESDNIALELDGSNVNGTISGGRLKASDKALNMRNGATLTEISGGICTSEDLAVHLSGAGTSINLISGGAFFQTDPDYASTSYGHAIQIERGATVGEFSGGYFEANRNCAAAVMSGGWVDKISNGEFVALRRGTYQYPPPWDDLWNSVIHIEGTTGGGYSLAGIDTISGGHFHGGARFGMLLITNGSGSSRVNEITGGFFEGSVAVQVDRGGHIGTISGGKIYGGQGILSVGTINTITGNADIYGSSSYGIYNYRSISGGGWIGEISGGKISANGSHAIQNEGVIDSISGGTITALTGTVAHGINNSNTSYPVTQPQINKITGGTITSEERGNGISNASIINEISGGTISGGLGTPPWITGDNYGNGIYNTGTITLISGGTVIGYKNAINCDGGSGGFVDTISNGIFWGQTKLAINLAKTLILEPGLTAIKGLGRYWGEGGVIFNNNSLVTFPGSYRMSVEKEPVAGITGVEFKYLRLPPEMLLEHRIVNVRYESGGVVFDIEIKADSSYVKTGMPMTKTDLNIDFNLELGVTLDFPAATGAIPALNPVSIQSVSVNQQMFPPLQDALHVNIQREMLSAPDDFRDDTWIAVATITVPLAAGSAIPTIASFLQFRPFGTDIWDTNWESDLWPYDLFPYKITCPEEFHVGIDAYAIANFDNIQKVYCLETPTSHNPLPTVLENINPGSLIPSISGKWTVAGHQVDTVSTSVAGETIYTFVPDSLEYYCDFQGNIAIITVENCTLLDCDDMGDKLVTTGLKYTHTGTGWDAIVLISNPLDSIKYFINGKLYSSGTTASLHGAAFPKGVSLVTVIACYNDIVDTCEFYVTIDPICPSTISDKDGNGYKVIKLAGLCWTENLKSTLYWNDDEIVWAQPYYSSIYPDTDHHTEIFGLLYSWYSAVGVPEQSDELPIPDIFGYVQGICPENWHVPSQKELDLLNLFSSDELKSKHYWLNPGTDLHGFDARPAGWYNSTIGRFEDLYGCTGWWTSDEQPDQYAHYFYISYYCMYPEQKTFFRSSGLSVRCVMD